MKKNDEQCLVSFLDILGFKEIVNDHVNGKKTDVLDKLKDALEIATDTIQMQELGNVNIKLKLKQFSDCTSIAVDHPSIKDPYKNEEQFIMLIFHSLLTISYFQNRLLSFDLYIRGGLSLGYHYENDNLIFSEGLIKSYELESKAVHPRIILDNELLDVLESLYKTHKEFMSDYSIDKLLISDWDGLVFINPFNLIEITLKDVDIKDRPKVIEEDKKLKSEISENVQKKIDKYKKEEDYGILRKYLWLKELIKWNNDENSSKIKFEYFLK